jgi:hypothetical protein
MRAIHLYRCFELNKIKITPKKIINKKYYNYENDRKNQNVICIRNSNDVC